MFPSANDSYVPIVRELAAGLMEGDGAAHLITVHPDPAQASSSWIHNESWLSFNTIQTWKSDFINYTMVANDYSKSPVKPVINGEARYEDEAGTTPLQVRNGAYWSCLAGGFYSYGHGGNWMRSHEFQIQEGDCGDYWGCAGAIFDIKAKKDQNNSYTYEKNGDLLTFSTTSSIGRHCIKFPDAEKPSGEWNTLDLYCFGRTSVHVVNDVVNMILQNSRQSEGDKEIPLNKGKIQIQSEGSEVFYRDIKICSIDKIPENILKEQSMAK